MISREQEVVMMISGKKILMGGVGIEVMAIRKWMITFLPDKLHMIKIVLSLNIHQTIIKQDQIVLLMR